MASQNKPLFKHCVGKGVGGGDGSGVGEGVGFQITTTSRLLVLTAAPAMLLEIASVKYGSAKSKAKASDTVNASIVLDCTIKSTDQTTIVLSSRN